MALATAEKLLQSEVVHIGIGTSQDESYGVVHHMYYQSRHDAACAPIGREHRASCGNKG